MITHVKTLIQNIRLETKKKTQKAHEDEKLRIS